MSQRTQGRSNTGRFRRPTASRSRPPEGAPPSFAPSRPRASALLSRRRGRAPGAWNGGSRTASARRATAPSAASSAATGETASGGAVPVRRCPCQRLLVDGSWPPPARRQLDSYPPRWPGAGTGLACGAARGNPAPTRGPAGCLLDGLPPGRRPRQGRCGTRCAPFLASLRDGLRPPLTRPSSRRPGETRSPGAGEEQRPTSRQHQEEDAMGQFEQDWLELGSRVARSLHYQAGRWQREARRWRRP
jgi:hypothetical protein